MPIGHVPELQDWTLLWDACRQHLSSIRTVAYICCQDTILTCCFTFVHRGCSNVVVAAASSVTAAKSQLASDDFFLITRLLVDVTAKLECWPGTQRTSRRRATCNSDRRVPILWSGWVCSIAYRAYFEVLRPLGKATPRREGVMHRSRVSVPLAFCRWAEFSMRPGVAVWGLWCESCCMTRH